MFFTLDEYRDRWRRVANAMAGKDYETLLVWQRGAGTYDRIGDVYWLTNFVVNGTGQDAANEEFGAPYTFVAVLIRRGHEPELHVGLPESYVDRSRVACGKVVSHSPNLITGLAQYLRTEGIEGRVALIGDDTLPGMYDRLLRCHTPGIEWHADEMLLTDPQSIKSARELEAIRIAGDIATQALTAAMEATIAGHSSAEAASRAAAIIVRKGGGYHRIDVHHGAETEHRVLSGELYGYSTDMPKVGEIIRGWVYGPLFEGYWLDPGRSAICGNKPRPEQRSLLEGAADVVNTIVAAIAPGITPRELGILGGDLARKYGYFDHPQLEVPLLGHGLGTGFVPYLIPVGEGEPDPAGKLKYDQPLKAGMVMAAEIFLTHPGVGTAGFEQNVIVGGDGAELLTKTPMLFW